jgi:glycosyltransferase involved in cell wall biosynthesis
MKTTEGPLVSIVIPAKNEAKLLPMCLSSIKQQRTTASYEVIVVDTNSEDNTPEIARSFGAHVINEPKAGKVYAFRTGANEARGAILCFAEADCVLPDTWIQTIVDYLKGHPDVEAISGSYIFHSSTLFYQALALIVHPLARGAYYLLYGSIPIRGSNFAIRKSTYRAVGGFPENYFELYDVELGRRVASIGLVHHVPGLQIKTSDRRFRGRILRFILEFFPSFVRNIVLKRPLRSQTYEDIR